MSSESTIEKTKNKSRAAEEAESDADERDEDDVDERDSDSDSDDGDGGNDAATRPMSTIDSGPKEKVALDRPSSFAMTMTIAKRELAAYFNSVVTYIVIGVSMVALGLFFFMYQGGFWQVDRVTMQRMFDFLPAALCFVIPLFTMRALADEKRVGTIELLITMPVKDSEVILGKYVAALAIVTMQLALVVLYPIAMFKWPWHLGELDWGAFWVGMSGLFLLSATGTAVGLMYSSFTDSQILSLFASIATLVALTFSGKLSALESLQGWPGDAIAFISLQTRFEPFARGLLDTRAIVYFVSIAVFCLVVAFHALERRKWS
ncbi:MAG: gliding motility protein GldF [Labilithrix sp.]|nr:gliding motility protein GldF [Labilithrix sp.]